MLAFLAVFAGTAGASAAPCTNLLTADEATPDGYGSAVDRVTGSGDLLIQGTECSGNTAEIAVGSGAPEQYVYKDGLYWNGSEWQDLSLSGSTLVGGSWYKGSATGSMPLGEQPNYVLGYVCQREEDEWKCGCSDEDCGESKWQMQALADAASKDDDGGVVAGSCIAPPVLSSPKVFGGTSCPPTSIDGGGRDVLIRMPKKVCTTPITIHNARNAHLIGGRIDLAKEATSTITFMKIKGTAHVEGLHIDVRGLKTDGVRIHTSPGATLTVQNSLIEGMGGVPKGIHGDVIHTQGKGPLDLFQVENLSGYTSYQGIFTPFRVPQHGSTGARRIVMKNMNLGYDRRMPDSQKPLMLLTLGSGNPKPTIYNQLDYSAPEGTTLRNVFIDTSRRNVAYYTMVKARPNPGSDGCATFDAVHKIDGKVCNGLPKTGPFVPQDQVGLNYARANFCTN